MRRVFFRSGKVTAVAHNGEAKQCQNTIMYAAVRQALFCEVYHLTT